MSLFGGHLHGNLFTGRRQHNETLLLPDPEIHSCCHRLFTCSELYNARFRALGSEPRFHGERLPAKTAAHADAGFGLISDDGAAFLFARWLLGSFEPAGMPRSSYLFPLFFFFLFLVRDKGKPVFEASLFRPD